jgi:hypothetical protein
MWNMNRKVPLPAFGENRKQMSMGECADRCCRGVSEVCKFDRFQDVFHSKLNKSGKYRYGSGKLN